MYALLPVHVPAPFDSLIVPVDDVPSPHAIVHVWVSALPGSLKDALTEAVEFVLKTVPASGLAIVTVGGAFATVAEKVLVAEEPAESVTVVLTV